MKFALVLAFAAVGLTACVTRGPIALGGAPDLTPVAGSPPPPHAKLYADCIAQAATASTYDRSADDETELVRFQCQGEPARLFYDALAVRSAAVGSQWTADGHTWRATNKVQSDLFGVDYCSYAPPGDYRCSLSFNAGAFLTAD